VHELRALTALGRTLLGVSLPATKSNALRSQEKTLARDSAASVSVIRRRMISATGRAIFKDLGCAPEGLSRR